MVRLKESRLTFGQQFQLLVLVEVFGGTPSSLFSLRSALVERLPHAGALTSKRCSESFLCKVISGQLLPCFFG